ncbi:MAG: PhzF family phenazine biosynthesis protein [Polyangiales bacterium]
MSAPVPLFHIDAFTALAFSGNPAAVALLEAPREPAWMQQVAAEMNLSETAFVVPLGGARFGLRWFTPTHEVPLCGHATLASYAALHAEGKAPPRATFETASGPLHVERAGDEYAMSLPAYAAPPVEAASIVELLGVKPIDVRLGQTLARKLLVVVESEAEVTAVKPRFDALRAASNPHDVKGVIVTARGRSVGVDFVSRFFAPWLGVDEDPVTGSAHCVLGPYWSERLGKSSLQARQISRRGGALGVTLVDDRVVLRASCVVVARGALLA